MMSFIKVLEDFDNIHSLITLLYKLQKEAGGENFLGGGKKTLPLLNRSSSLVSLL